MHANRSFNDLPFLSVWKDDNFQDTFSKSVYCVLDKEPIYWDQQKFQLRIPYSWEPLLGPSDIHLTYEKEMCICFQQIIVLFARDMHFPIRAGCLSKDYIPILDK